MAERSHIEVELDRLAESQSLPGAELQLVVDGGTWTCKVLDVNQLACSLESIVLHKPERGNVRVAELQQRAGAIASRLRYLLEPLEILEVDPEAQVVQMRSSPPHREDGAVCYYEIEVRPGESRIARFLKAPGREREAIALTLTREAFHRLVSDVATAR